jgi:hypothetical protein
MARTWSANAGRLFEVDISRKVAIRNITSYGEQLGVPVAAALASIGRSSVRFHALALGAGGAALPIVNSDEGFELLFGRPSASMLDEAITAVMRPFPAGLLTDVGIVVANPVYAPPETQARFSKNAYHGTVIWSWQQALFAAGLERQLKRDDLSNAIKQRLRRAQVQLWHVIDEGEAVRNSELWSWRYGVAAFGASAADVDESNAAQLWSTVYLAIPKPADFK